MGLRSIPPSAFALALAGCALLLVLDVAILPVAATLLVWLGSLWLVGDRPQASEATRNPAGISRATMGQLIEHSETPVLVTERDRVAIANLAARDLLGAHVVGQDVRMALRQPEAIGLLDSESDGSALVHGLVRRRDIWRVNRRAIDGGLAVIEFVDRTAEADIGRAHTDFVANASHELRTPLAAIIGYVETLREDDAAVDEATRQRFMDTILREARRLQSLVSDLMSLSRIEAEKHDLPIDLIDFSALTERAARDAAGPERAERIAIEAPHAFMVQGDMQQLEQLVRNLVDNALKYGSDAAPVSVSLAANKPGHVLLTVRDRGDGIPAEHIPHLTRRFYRTDPGRSRASGGTGLGLAIVKHIVERHRGRLDIESAPGDGTSVHVALPSEGDAARA